MERLGGAGLMGFRCGWLLFKLSLLLLLDFVLIILAVLALGLLAFSSFVFVVLPLAP